MRQEKLREKGKIRNKAGDKRNGKRKKGGKKRRSDRMARRWKRMAPWLQEGKKREIDETRHTAEGHCIGLDDL